MSLTRKNKKEKVREPRTKITWKEVKRPVSYTHLLYAEGCHLYKDKVQGLAEEKDRFKEALIMAEQSDVVVMLSLIHIYRLH